MTANAIIKWIFVLLPLCALAEPVRNAEPSKVESAKPHSPGPALNQKFWSQFRQLKSQGKEKEAQELLLGQGQDWTGEQQSLRLFALGVEAIKNSQWDEAILHLQSSLKLGTRLSAIATFHIGEAYMGKALNFDAKKQFQNVLQMAPTQDLVLQTRFRLGEIAFAEQQWKAALDHFQYLQKRGKSLPNYDQVIWRLVQVERARRNSGKMCRWAKRLYTDYPASQFVSHWGVDFAKAEVEGKRLGCSASVKDRNKRLRRLQLAGEAERANREIEELRSKLPASENYEVDRLQVNFLVNEGQIEKALDLLIKHFDQQKSNFGYLILVGKTAARAGEFQTAVAAYYRAHQLAGKSRHGREALYQAAFLSYQYQDYDGALRKFEEFVKKFPGSGLVRDARWNLAWIRYLRGDFQGALANMKDLSKMRLSRRKRRTAGLDQQKIQYWTSMCHLRLENVEQARTGFQALAKDKSLGFYSLLSTYRLKTLPAAPAKAVTKSPAESQAEVATTAGEAAGEEGDGQPVSSATSAEENESEEALASQNATDTDEGGDEADAPEEVETADAEEELTPTLIQDPKLVTSFERARDLHQLGYWDWAKGELYDIERKTRNSTYLRNLMSAYQDVNQFFRSSSISQNYFVRERYRQGIEGARTLWEFAYPKAYNDWVKEEAKSFRVPEEFVWAIMRAESQYRVDAVSPVGAVGLMQLMPNTARQMARLTGVDGFLTSQLYAPKTNVQLGTRYLSRLLRLFNNNIPVAAAAYNAGPHRAGNWLRGFGNLEMDEFIEHIPFIETRNYVKRVVANYQVYKRIYSKQNDPTPWLIQPIDVEISSRPFYRETWEAL